MGTKLTAGVLVGALAVVLTSGAAATRVLGQPSVGKGDSAAGRYAQARSLDVGRWLTPPSDKKYSGKQLVAALLAERGADSKGVVVLALPARTSGTITTAPVGWSGTTASSGGARVTMRIDVDVAISSDRLWGPDRQVDGAATRCFVYTIQGAEVTVVRGIRCPPAAEVMKAPQPKPLRGA
ncbi:hypothetical protein [Cellulomonas edaphi]|uniref:Uncharacterized protein n=1 Tax=Cellulomonas edaphi TaxID=3053468 RepID=A0ABT7S7I2_9CELL|nr:hypothetical protein [Cellulomons edaphi]MDM7831588.1 hypothetical protein [Cellulomons edaphi]